MATLTLTGFLLAGLLLCSADCPASPPERTASAPPASLSAAPTSADTFEVQTTPAGCGPAAAANLLIGLGAPVTQVKVIATIDATLTPAEIASAREYGYSADQLETFFHRRGYRAKVVRLDAADLPKIPVPFLLLIVLDSRPHWTLLRGVDQDDQAWVLDANLPDSVPLKTLVDLWVGIALVVEPTDGWPPEHALRPGIRVGLADRLPGGPRPLLAPDWTLTRRPVLEAGLTGRASGGSRSRAADMRLGVRIPAGPSTELSGFLTATTGHAATQGAQLGVRNVVYHDLRSGDEATVYAGVTGSTDERWLESGDLAASYLKVLSRDLVLWLDAGVAYHLEARTTSLVATTTLQYSLSPSLAVGLSGTVLHSRGQTHSQPDPGDPGSCVRSTTTETRYAYGAEISYQPAGSNLFLSVSLAKTTHSSAEVVGSVVWQYDLR